MTIIDASDNMIEHRTSDEIGDEGSARTVLSRLLDVSEEPFTSTEYDWLLNIVNDTLQVITVHEP